MSKFICTTAATACLAVSASAQTETPHWSLTWKKLLMTGPELELVGSLPTRTTHELGASDWSIGCETLDRDYGNFDNYKPFLSEQFFHPGAAAFAGHVDMLPLFLSAFPHENVGEDLVYHA